MKNVVLIGFMGTGKSSCGKALATRLGCAFTDLDSYIEEKEGMSIPEIFEAKGEAYFREREREAVRENARRKNVVIATGGGVVEDEENLAALRKRGVIVCLTADVDTILRRTARRGERPMLDSGEDRRKAVEDLLARRRGMYAKADFTVDTGVLSPLQVAEEIIRILKHC